VAQGVAVQDELARRRADEGLLEIEAAVLGFVVPAVGLGVIDDIAAAEESRRSFRSISGCVMVGDDGDLVVGTRWAIQWRP